MSEYDKPKQPEFDPNFRIPSTEELLDSARKAQEALQNPPTEVQNFLDKHGKTIVIVVGTLVVYKINKRMVRKVVTKAIRNDTAILKEHLNQLTVSLEDLAEVAYDKRFASGSFLRKHADAYAATRS